MFGIWIGGDKRQRGEVITGNSGGAVFVNCLRPVAQPQRELVALRQMPTDNTVPWRKRPLAARRIEHGLERRLGLTQLTPKIIDRKLLVR